MLLQSNGISLYPSQLAPYMAHPSASTNSRMMNHINEIISLTPIRQDTTIINAQCSAKCQQIILMMIIMMIIGILFQSKQKTFDSRKGVSALEVQEQMKTVRNRHKMRCHIDFRIISLNYVCLHGGNVHNIRPNKKAVHTVVSYKFQEKSGKTYMKALM